MTSTSAFIGRQAVLNRNQQLIGYELLFRPSGEASGVGKHTELQADTQVLVNTLNNMGTSWLIGSKLAFINIGEAMLSSDFLELLPPRRVILDISPRIVPSNELLSRARHLRSLGFGISLDDFSFESPAAAFLELANYVKLDIQHQDTNRFQMLASRLRSYPVIRIAERVETHAQFHLCKELGMDGFQGFYFAKPETLSAKVIHPSFRNTLELLNLLRLDADIRDVEQVLKRDLALSYKLLRYVNSAAAGLNTSISSFSHAVTVLGYQKLYRWLTLLLVTASDEGHAPPALQKTAVTRGRFMELLGKAHGERHDTCDNLFIIGMFSLLDVLFDMPMANIIEHLQLPESITEALLHEKGTMSRFLKLVKACEDGQLAGVPELCAQLNLSSEQFNQAHVSALAWVEELGL
ncbi:HDOD domain-containing protein [Chromobacterium haemolyticum]|uniref:HDOD domain-containing protein n=1 Tax=Chromobacterium fluminis TaxID=3044269 RepID=A0ABX0L594_9NEIS|nr:EAL domain-containing protein [Chromobacterium haemolyticum]NHR04812.1 HDOD domain-containing protein [Chromobacterium haemolyticum]OQS41193.1 diguanylate phosphodiesterase [Chromobacterium haemolyticum]